MNPRLAPRPDHVRRSPAARRGHSLEILEARIAPAALASSIVRAGGVAPDTAAGSVAFTVTFSEAVTGVDATDFIVHTEGNAHANTTVTVAGSGNTYTVTVGGLHGQGEVRLDLVDNDSITGPSGALGGAGASNGSFQGAAWHLLQTFPQASITANGPSPTDLPTVTWTVTFSEGVTGVDPADFTLLKTGVNADAAVTVTPGSPGVYTVRATGVSGNGTLALKLLDNGTIKDTAGNPLQGAPPPTFATQQTFATGSTPHSLVLADVNADGVTDLIVGNRTSDSVSVLLGNGNGTFAAQQTFATGSKPFSVAVSDLDGDGKPDIVAANNYGNSVSVLLGNGNGTFGTQQTFATGTGPKYVVVGDVNGDGKPDLVVANYTGNTISLLLGNGNGTFGAQQTVATGNRPNALALADVNGDGKLDLAIVNLNNSTMSVLLGNGNGTFGTAQIYNTGLVPFAVAVGDVNGDGQPDLAVANNNSANVGVFLGNGNGTFAAQQIFATGSNVRSVAIGDVNGDGKPDLIAGNLGNANVSVLLGDGAGSFATQQTFAAGMFVYSVAAGDLNGDGRLDIAAVNQGPNTASVLLGVDTFTGGAVTIVPPNLLATLDASGNVTITDTNVAGKINQLTVRRAGSGLEITDATERFQDPPVTSPVSVLSNGGRTMTIPWSAVTGAIILNTGGASDAVTLDLSGGDFINAAGVTFNGGESAGDDDRLTITGYNLFIADGVADVTVKHTGVEAGNVILAGLGTVIYAQLESLTLSGTAADLVMNLPAVANTATLGDDGDAGNASSRLRAATFERTDFTNPTNSLTINRGQAADTLTINALPDFTAALALGAPASPFTTITFAGAVSLAPGKTLTAAVSGGLTVNAPLKTDGGAITLLAGNGITLNQSVATGGGAVVMKADSDGNGTGTLTVAAAVLGAFTQQAQLVDSGGAANDYFGQAAAISADGNTAVVSAYLDDVGSNPDQGSAFVFVRAGGVWTQQAKLTAADGAAADTSGRAVAISGDGNTVIVGVEWDDVGGKSDQGSATVFTRTGNVWTQQAQLVAPDGQAGDNFGAAVALSGDGNIAVVSDIEDTVGSHQTQGSVRVFTRTGGVWTQQAMLTAADGASGTDEFFGNALSLTPDGSTLLIGHRDDTVGSDTLAGSAYIFTSAGGVWTQQARLTSGGSSGGIENFGTSVALSGDGNTAIIGADDDATGSALVFTRTGNVWARQAVITGPGNSGSFGGSVSLSGDGNIALVGAEFSTVGGNGSQGTATLFTRVGATWTQRVQFTGADGAANDRFGFSVALSSDGSTVLAGANQDDIGAHVKQGSAYTLASSGNTPGGSILAGNGTITLEAADANIGGTISSTGTVTIYSQQSGRAIDLGTNTAGKLGLTEAELDAIVASTLQIGDANSGAISITGVISPASYPTLNLGNAATFTATGGFAADVTSATVYEKMVVAGAVTINPAATLTVTAVDSYSPAHGLSFTIIENTSGTATTGTFSGKADGTLVSLGTSLKVLFYGQGAGGNDVVLHSNGVSVAIGNPASVTESSTSGLVYTFTRTGSGAGPVPVNFTVGGTAAFTSDYTATSTGSNFDFAAGTVTIPALQPSVTVSVKPVDDRTVEGTETVILTVAAGSSYGILNSPAPGTITDNDTATLSFAAGSSMALESAGTKSIGVTLTLNTSGTTAANTAGLSSNLTVDLTGDGGTATGGGTDYTLPGSPAVFSAGTYATGTATQNSVLSIVDDRLVEGNETVALGLVIAQNIGTQVSLGGTTAHTLTLTDNDTATLSFSTSTSSVSEGAGIKNIGVTLTLNTIGTTAASTAGLVSALSAELNFTSGSALDGADFTLPGSPAVFSAGTYATGTASQAAVFSIFDDRLVEGTETARFGLSIVSNIGTQASVGGTTTHFLTINDNDSATIGFVSAASTAGEGAGTDPLDLVLRINATGTGPAMLARDAVVRYDVVITGTTADIYGSDFTLPVGATFTRGSVDLAIQPANLSIVNDSGVEGTETVISQVVMSQSTMNDAVTVASAAAAHTTTIVDDDFAQINFSTSSSTVGEGTTSDPIGFTLTILPGPGSLGTGDLQHSVTFQVLPAGGTSTVGADYTLPSLLTFNSGGGLTQMANLHPVNDQLVEGSEVALLGLAITNDRTGGQVSIAMGASHAATITDNDTATVIFSSGTSTAAESAGTQSVSAVLVINATGIGDPGLASDVAVNLTTSGGLATSGGTDYSLPGQPAFTFQAGSYPSGLATQSSAITIADDRLVEGDETVALGLAVAQNIGTQVGIGGVNTHTLTITDNDTATIGFTAGLSTAGESAGTLGIGTTLTIIASGSGAMGLASDLKLDLIATGGTATGGGIDYALPGSAAVTFAAGDYATGTATQNGVVSIADDRLVEGDETAALALAIISNIGTQVSLTGASAHTLNILDNDTATLGFTVEASTAPEQAGTHDIAVTLTLHAVGDGPLGLAADLTANLTTIGGTATGGGIDYTLPAIPAVTFAAGEYPTGAKTKNGAVTVSDDTIVEASETAELALVIDHDGRSGQVALAGPAAAHHRVTILDDDTATVTLSGGIAHAEGRSGTTAYTFTATLDHAVQGGFSVGYMTSDGTATEADHDYAVSSGTLTFAGTAGETQTITVLATGDTKFENDETFTVALGALSGSPAGLSVAGAPQIGTITNDDGSPVISIADVCVTEGNPGGAVSLASLTVSLSNTSILPVTVDFATANGTAIAPGDYTAITHSTLTFAPGETSATISVGIRPDTLFESGANETFLVKLSNPHHATLGNAQAVGTIFSDDGAPAHAITIDAKHPYTFFDDNHDKVTVKLTGLAFGTLVLDGGVVNGADISEIKIAGNSTASTLSVAVTRDKSSGDGLVRLGEVTVDGALLSFSGPAVDFTVGGLRAVGPVKSITAHALLAGEIITGGVGADQLALTLGALGATGDPFLVATPQTISALKAASIGVGRIDAAALTSISVTAGPLAADITSVGAMGSIAVKGGELSGDLVASRFGAVTVTGGGFSGSLTSLTPAATLGATKALTSLSVTTGNLSGLVKVAGASGAITVKGGAMSGELTAASFGAVSVSGGDFSGSLTSLTPGVTLRATKALTSLTVTDGNLTGDIRLLGASGAISVTSKLALGRGDIVGASIVASAIASLTVGRDFISSIFLAGADLGDDYAFGGTDTFAAGTLGAVKIGRNVSGAGTIIGAGFSTTDTHLKDANDTIIGGVASIIASLNVTGTAGAETYFAAGLFKTAPKIAGALIMPAADARFKRG